jgi:2-keto-4-pentenoate hydratase/2-oxohepta-3-ene-1,7-dioic acid hydratase in catechol pathway
MRVARFKCSNGTGYGFVMGEEIVPAEGLGLDLPHDLFELISSERLMDENFRSELERAVGSHRGGLRETDVRLLSPIPRPGKLICLGKNYFEHVQESGSRPPEGLVIFMKPATAVTGPYDEILYPSVTSQLDYEGELAVVLGKRCKGTSMDEAMETVLGYMVMNDVSARDLQFRDGQWTRGKGCDTFAPTGPYITMASEVPDPHELRLRTWVNGELRQDSNTGKMIRRIPEVISILSQGMTLEPGDIIATGTPGGVGYYWRPEPRLLKVGDRVRVQVEKIGAIENMVSRGP